MTPALDDLVRRLREAMPSATSGSLAWQAWEVLCSPANMATLLDALTEAQTRARLIAGEAYQFAGAVGAPQRVLDALSAEAQGPTVRLTYLPISADECSEVADAKAEAASLREQVQVLEEDRAQWVRAYNTSTEREKQGVARIRELQGELDLRHMQLRRSQRR